MKSERGNAFFLILIAVVMFAALSYAVTSSTRMNGKGAAEEKAKLIAANVMGHISAIRTAVSRLKYIGKCAETELSFAPSEGYYDDNPNAPTDYHCHIFSTHGGGVAWDTLPPNFFDTTHALYNVWFAQYWFIPNNNLPNISGGTDAKTDLLLSLIFVKRDVCLAFNKLVGIPEPIPEVHWPSGYQVYATDSDPMWSDGSEFAGNAILGRSEMCTVDPGGYYAITAVILPR